MPTEEAARAGRRVREGEVVSRAEAPRGEVIYYIRSDGSDSPARIKIRTPTLPALAILNGSWSISEIIAQQAELGWMVVVQPVGFALAVVGLIGKLKRVPFDIPKAKSEVVGGR